MPLYEYQCESCAHRFERIQKSSEAPIPECPLCAGVVRKLMSSPAIQFKGTGWYITDYARKTGTSAGDSKSTSDGDSAGGTSKDGTSAGAASGGGPAESGASKTESGGSSSGEGGSSTSAPQTTKPASKSSSEGT